MRAKEGHKPRGGAVRAEKGARPRSAEALSKEQVLLLRDSFAEVEKKAGLVALDFYRNLFTLDPSLRPLFQSDIEVQGRKLVEALGYTLQSLENPAALTPVLEAMGRRHVGYGVRDEHYHVVIEALMLTLRQLLGTGLTAPAAHAWRMALEYVAAAMKRGAAPVLSMQR